MNHRIRDLFRRLTATVVAVSLLSAGPAMARPTNDTAGPAPTATTPHGLQTLAAHVNGRKAAHRHRIADDLAEEVDDVAQPRFSKREQRRWAREHRGQRQVQVIITTDADDPAMLGLRQRVEELGGEVQAVYTAVRAMTVVVPKRAVRRLARHHPGWDR